MPKTIKLGKWRQVGKAKRIETMTALFAHLITTNSDRSFNEVWDTYFKDLPVGTMCYNDVKAWLEEFIEVEVEI